MRMLPEDEQNAILEATCSTIRNGYPFDVGQASSIGPCGENIRIISGEEEGMWGWVAVNYLMDGFGHSSKKPQSTPEGTLLPLEPLADPPPDSSQDSVTPVDVNHHLPTFGFLDMGGASTQLAFSPTKEELAKSEYPENQLGRVKLRLLSGEDVEWPVFVASWLGYGTNKARERYVDRLVDRWKQYHADETAIDLATPIGDPCLPKDLRIPSDDSQRPDLIGTGAFAKCLVELTPLLEHATPCPSSHCLFAGRPTPYIDFDRQDQRGFIGVSEYWYTAQQVLGLGGIWDWGEWEQGMGEFCQRQWTGIEEQVEKEKGWLGAEVG
jgi:Golgi apyrase